MGTGGGDWFSLSDKLSSERLGIFVSELAGIVTEAVRTEELEVDGREVDSVKTEELEVDGTEVDSLRTEEVKVDRTEVDAVRPEDLVEDGTDLAVDNVELVIKVSELVDA